MYKNYGERGIYVCKKWHNPINFCEWALVNGYKDGLSLERIDVDGIYTPLNCSWIDVKEQNRNKTNVLGWDVVNEIREKLKMGKRIKELTMEYGVHKSTIQRIKHNVTYAT